MGISLNGTGGSLTLSGMRDKALEKALNDETKARQAADETLKDGKVDKESGKGLSNLKEFIVFKGDWVREGECQIGTTEQSGSGDILSLAKYDFVNAQLDKKSDRPTTSLKSSGGDVSYILHDEASKNTSYLQTSTAISSISFEIGSGEFDYDYTSSLSFKTAQTPPQISYTGSKSLIWVGSDCTLDGDNSIFAPIANKVYDIVFYFNGLNFVGLVNGYTLAEG